MKKNLVLLVLMAIALTALSACGGKTETATEETGEAVETAALVQTYESAEAKVGDTVVCPVTKTEVEVKEDTLFAEVNGKKIYVCSQDCLDAVTAEPDKYLKVAEKTEEVAEEATEVATE